MQLFQILGAGAALAAGFCLIRSEHEKNHFVTETFRIHSPKVKGEGKRFVFLSDLHNKEFGAGNRKLVEAVRAARPDAVFIGGDMMVAKGGKNISVALGLMEKLVEICPVYYGNGNHEIRMKKETEIYKNLYRDYVNATKSMGVVWLSDAFVTLDRDFVLCGLDLIGGLYRPGYPKMPPGFIEKRLGKTDREKFTILLAHSPMFFPRYASWGADLTLSGHFHGGTIRLPFLGGVMTPQYQFFYPWSAGIFEKNGRNMIVSRGLGTHSVNIRLGNKPQVVVVEIVK